MKLKPTQANIRIYHMLKDLDGVILDHETIAVKHGVTIFNLRYMLRKMVDLGILELERSRDTNGKIDGTYSRILIQPELELSPGEEIPIPKQKK